MAASGFPAWPAKFLAVPGQSPRGAPDRFSMSIAPTPPLAPRACPRSARFAGADHGLAVLAGTLAFLLAIPFAPAQSRPMETEDLFRLKRVGDSQISPDGRQVVYVVTEVLKEENRTNSDLWLVPADGAVRDM